ncbi:hypothetical protein LCGC14_2787880 [marine sediment metagenome]|uniref:Uncharacterized protein n=1 Tax=marine sediment metagenome TaxID=412755 RepID=A0A0F8YRG1_9ZZZZ
MSETPMTDKTMRERLARYHYSHEYDSWTAYAGYPWERVPDSYEGKQHAYKSADFILAIPEIKEGQELREKAESGKLVEKRCEVCDGEVQPHDDYCEPCRLLVNTEEDHQADELTRHQGV